MKLGIAIAALAIVAVPASAQTTGAITSRDNTPQVPASTTVTSTDGNNRTLSVPVMAAVGTNQPPLRGAGTLATVQVSVGTTATQVVAARTGRHSVTISVGAANACYYGNAGVTATTGFAIQPVAGASRTLPYSGALFMVCSATTTISADEIYG